MTRFDRAAAACLLALAASLRLYALGAAPPAPDEAAHAWRALRLAEAGDASVHGLASPAAASMQAVVFALAGGGDALARMPSAACGLALVLLPLLAWARLGRVRALSLCALLAVDPWLVGGSRRAGGDAAAALGAALVLLGLWYWSDAARRRADAGRRAALATAAAAGFLAATGPAAWWTMPPLALVAWRLRPWRDAPVRPGPLLACAFAAAVGCSTAGLLAVPWASAVSASLTAALADRPTGAALAAFAAVPSAALVLALPAVVLSRGRRGLHAAALAWGAWALLVSPWGTPALALACVASAADAAVALAEGTASVRVRGALLSIPAVVLAALAPSPAPVSTERGLAALAADVREIAVERGFGANEMPVVIVQDPPDPEIAWALRGARRLRFTAVRPGGEDAPLLVAPADATGQPSGHARRDYGSGPGAVSLWVPRAR